MFSLRTATLDDIYRHIANSSAVKSTKNPPFRRISVEENDYEEGHVTGYAVEEPYNNAPVGIARPENHLLETNENNPQSIAGNKAGLIYTHSEYYFVRDL